ncbi:MAG: PH domain-containing protein [Bacilli bacterium]|nr:PH domain-containing protein [Bacilli bacterium]MDD4054121.1 PH domain-containing protein [Bacilli bacterium]
MKSIYPRVMKFKAKHPLTVGWRTKAHCRVVEDHINDDEKVVYAFTAQKNDNYFDIITTCVVVLTDKRIIIGQKRVLFGYFFYSITPDMYNDFQIKMGLIWGKVYIDTVKELVILSNISKSALVEIETEISTLMMREKKKYGINKRIRE